MLRSATSTRSGSTRAAITAVFFVNGLVFTSVYARLPAIQAHLELRPGALGLALLGAIAFCALLAEGAMFDWSSVYLARQLRTTDGVAALGLAAFSVAMGAGRLAADPLASRFGGPATARAGAILATAGLATALATTSPGVAAAGLAAMGLGLSALFPLTLQATGRHAAPGPALAAISTLGYAGFLTGPATIGLLAEVAGLRAALLPVCALCLLAALLTRHLANPPTPRQGTAP